MTYTFPRLSISTPLQGPSFIPSGSLRNPSTGRKSSDSSAEEPTASAQRTTGAASMDRRGDIGILLRDVVVWTTQNPNRRRRSQQPLGEVESAQPWLSQPWR